MLSAISAANNASTARLNNIINQLKNCQRYGNVGTSLQTMQSQGKLVLDSSQPGAVGWTSGWWDPTIHIYPDGSNIDPVTVVHEWWHASRAQGQVLMPFWIGANNINESPVGAASAGAGLGLTLADAALEGGKVIPIAGNVLSVLTGGYDAYQLAKTIQRCW